MKKILVCFLASILILSLASCKSNQSGDVMKAWTGDYSDEKLKNAINEYQNNYSPIVSDGKAEITNVSFKTDFEIASCSVNIVSSVENNDINAELQGAVYLYVESTFDGKEVTVSTDWWYDNDDWTKNYTIWSYLICVKDMDGAEHYYYFRTDYSSND